MRVTLLLVLCLACVTAVELSHEKEINAGDNPLIEYVYAKDPTYKWNVSSVEITGPTYTVYNMFLTSQTWLTAKDSSQPVWTHWVQICVPKSILTTKVSLLYIDGFSNKNFTNPPTKADQLITELCSVSKTVASVIYQIPNEPISFPPDNIPRSEDGIIAYTWSHFLNHSSEYDWLLRWPMTKASVRAMDAIQEFMVKKIHSAAPEEFIIAGASKRGWTTWMVGCMDDPRVTAIVPIVAPIANIVPQFNEQYRSYGEFSFAVHNYVNQGIIPGFLNTDEFIHLLEYINPANYKETLEKIPKYVVIASQDEFFMPDSARYYWDDLTGEKYLWIVQNADHSLAQQLPQVLQSLLDFYGSVGLGLPRPEYHWEISEEGKTISFQSKGEAKVVNALCWASEGNPKRDWRLYQCDDPAKCHNPHAHFTSTKITPDKDGNYVCKKENPASGYTAFYVTVEYALLGGDEGSFFSSDMSIIPQTLPYPPCGSKCECRWKC